MSSPLWNYADLCPPPNSTHETNRNNRVVSELAQICTEAVLVLNKLDLLNKEGAAMSRIIYRYKRKLHKDKGFKGLEKVNRNLRRYLRLNLANAFSDFSPRCPELHEVVAYLPSCQMLEWLLIRVQGFSRLFFYISQCCEDVAVYLKLKLSQGHMWGSTLLFLSLISRVWVFSKYLVLQADEWYKKLRPYLKILPVNNMAWLPPDYEFPSDIIGWLNSEYNVSHKVEPSLLDAVSHKQNSLELLNICEEEEEEDSVVLLEPTNVENKSILVNNRDGKSGKILNENSALSLKKSQKEHFTSQIVKDRKAVVENLIHLVNPTLVQNGNTHEDIGCAVSRNSLKSFAQESQLQENMLFEKPQLSKKPKLIIRNHKELERFISCETKLRKKCDENCMTRNLDKLRWRMLLKRLKKFVRKLEKLKDDEIEYSNLVFKVRKEIKSAIL